MIAVETLDPHSVQRPEDAPKQIFNEPMQVLARHFRFRSSGKCPTDGHHAEKPVLGILEV